MNPKPRVELVTLGDELLLGLRPNGHLTYLGSQLARRGLPVMRNTVIPDSAEAIERLFPDSWQAADIIITTGGLGPTSDDNTREAIAKCLGLELVFDPWAKEALEARFSARGIDVNQRQMSQCYKPRGSDLLTNRIGTAPGIFLRHEGKLLIMLPGPTHELKLMFENEVLPKLAAEGYASEQDTYLQLRTFGIPEGQIEDYLAKVLADHPEVNPAFCTSQGIVDVRLSGKEQPLPWVKLRKVGEACGDALGEHFVCFGHCSLARVVLDQLRSMEKTLATAESCTGGLLSSAFTDVAGASKGFVGGSVCYCNDSKIQVLDVPECILHQHGAVSAEVAVAMATGAAEFYSSDYGLSITGYAGPDGGTPENPAGTIYIGYHSPIGAWAQKVVYPGDRITVKARAVNAALDFMRRKIKKYKLVEFLQMEGDTAQIAGW